MVVNFASISAPTQELLQVFQTIDTQSCPRFFNFHMHTVYSDGQFQPEALIQQAITISLKGLAITDHHTVSGYQVAQNCLETWVRHNSHPEASIPRLWSGVEINAELLGIEVHILGYNFDLKHSCLKPYLQGKTASGSDYQAEAVIAAIHEASGLAILAHPARYRRSHFDLIPAAAELGIDGVETYYAYDNPKPWRPSASQTQQVKQLADQYCLLNTCGTDTHGLSLLQRL